MAESNANNEAVSKSSYSAQELEEVVRTMGLIFTNTFLYGPKHGVTLKAGDDSFTFLEQILQKCGDISFSASDAGLTVNETVVELKNPLMHAFASRMTDLEISSFGLKQGLKRENFDKLVELMNTKSEEIKKVGGFAQAVLLVGIEGVRTRVVTYKAVTEDEIIVSKKTFDGDAAEGGPSVEEMVAFLGGAGSETPEGEPAKGQEGKRERAERGLQQMSADPGKLGDAILQAAEAGRKQPGSSNQQEVTALVVGCLKKVYDVLSKNPGVKTQKGKKNLSRTLVTLEKEILARMKAKAAAGEDVSERAQDVSEVIEAMNDELEIDVLAADYMRKRNAIESNERRILRFIKSKGLDKVSDTELRQRLEEGGLSSEQWRQLLAKSCVGHVEGLGGEQGGAAAEGHLAILLAHMEDLVAGKAAGCGGAGAPGPGRDAQQLTTMVAAVDEEIRELVVKTEQKIRDLVQVIREEEGPGAEVGTEAKPGEPKAPLARKRLMVLLAEVVQELCQPLSVINCSIDMIKAKYLGEVTDSQLEMLNLAATSGDRVRVLVDKLLELSGLPKTLTPDAGIQSSLYAPEP